MQNTKYLIMFKSPSILEKFKNKPGQTHIIPSEDLRNKIINKMFNGNFDYEKHSVFEFTVDEIFTNLLGTFNGGVIMTLVDILTGISGYLLSEEIPLCVSASITTHFLKSAFAGEKVYIKCQTDRRGRRLIFYSCEMYNYKFKKIALGSHVMAVIKNAPRLGAKLTSNQMLKSKC